MTQYRYIWKQNLHNLKNTACKKRLLCRFECTYGQTKIMTPDPEYISVVYLGEY